MTERTVLDWTINGKAAQLSVTVAALLALEDQGLCIVTMAANLEPGARFLLTPGKAALALAIGERQHQLEQKQKVSGLVARQAEILTEARKRPAGTAALAMEGTGYLASIQKDMSDSLEEEQSKDPKA